MEMKFGGGPTRTSTSRWPKPGGGTDRHCCRCPPSRFRACVRGSMSVARGDQRRGRRMLALIVMIVVGWLLAKWLWPRIREPIYEPPVPQIVIHLHQPLIVLTKAEPPLREL